jgi:serine/threonine-protein kinase HipA
MGRRVAHILPYRSPWSDEATAGAFLDVQKRMSISGMQVKYSLVLDKNKLRLTREGERGTHILKPIPQGVERPDQVPANEHLTMQIARQVFGIETAESALIFFQDGQPAYITRRFDVNGRGGQLAKEDFASLAGLTPRKDGERYKYLGCYLDLFDLMRRYLSIYRIEAPKLFRLVIFNYLFSNGDAHLRNFSLLETPMGDFRLSPAYDLLNTHLHVRDTAFALADGLLPVHYHPGAIRIQMLELARRADIPEAVARAILDVMLAHTDDVASLTAAAYLADDMKVDYLAQYARRRERLMA